MSAHSVTNRQKMLAKYDHPIEQWRRYYNTRCPHSSRGYRPPAHAAHWPTPMTAQQPGTIQ
nr:integrase core domain-containing protein [Ralstonia solanacearum]